MNEPLRVVLVAVNARYSHTNLALRCLRKSLKNSGVDCQVKIKEFTINEPLDSIVGEIYEEKPELLGFSCYIWNIDRVLTLAARLKQICPQAFLLFGGPEVSFDPLQLLSEHTWLDGVLTGEGEVGLPILAETLAAGNLSLSHIPNLAWRKGATCQWNVTSDKARGERVDLNQLGNPYDEEEDFSGKLVYLETSRGCPYSCAFCLSSAFQGVRYLEPEALRPILAAVFHQGARVVKFVDRTFNAQKRHAFAVLDIFRQEAERCRLQEGEIRVHCEMAGDLLDEEWLEYLNHLPQGMIQLEIGVQSTHGPTLKAIHREQDFTRWKGLANRIREAGVLLHVDLIAGLPLDTWESFRRSFEETAALYPQKLQLGFLKVLKGSPLRQLASRYGLIFAQDPPYRVLATAHMPYEKILALERIEELLERYYNAGAYEHILKEIVAAGVALFDWLEFCSEEWLTQGWFKKPASQAELFRRLWLCAGSFLEQSKWGEEEISDWRERWRNALKLDFFLLSRPGHVPDFLQSAEEIAWRENKEIKRIAREKERWLTILPEAVQMDRRQWERKTFLAYFSLDAAGFGSEVHWYLFYYGAKTQVLPITESGY